MKVLGSAVLSFASPAEISCNCLQENGGVQSVLTVLHRSNSAPPAKQGVLVCCNGVQQNSHRATAVPKQCHNSATAMPQQCHRSATAVPQQCHNNGVSCDVRLHTMPASRCMSRKLCCTVPATASSASAWANLTQTQQNQSSPKQPTVPVMLALLYVWGWSRCSDGRRAETTAISCTVSVTPSGKAEGDTSSYEPGQGDCNFIQEDQGETQLHRGRLRGVQVCT